MGWNHKQMPSGSSSWSGRNQGAVEAYTIGEQQLKRTQAAAAEPDAIGEQQLCTDRCSVPEYSCRRTRGKLLLFVTCTYYCVCSEVWHLYTRIMQDVLLVLFPFDCMDLQCIKDFQANARFHGAKNHLWWGTVWPENLAGNLIWRFGGLWTHRQIKFRQY